MIERGVWNPIRGLPIRWKLFATTAVVGFVAILIAIGGLTRMQTLNDRMNRIVDVATAKSKLASLMKQELVTATRAEKNMILAKSEVEMNRHSDTVETALQELTMDVKKLRPLVKDETRSQLDQFLEKWLEWEANHAKLRQMTSMDSDVRARNLSSNQAREQVDQLDRQLSLIADGQPDASVLATIAEIRISVLRLQRVEKNLILAANPLAIDEHAAQMQPLEEKIRSQLDQLRQLAGGDHETELDAAGQAIDRYLAISKQIGKEMGEGGNVFVFHLAYVVGEPLADESELLLDAIVSGSEEEIDQLRANSAAAYLNAHNGLLTLSVLGIGASLLISFVIGERISRNLRKLATYATEIHDASDLSKPIPAVGDDEVGQVAEALDQMRDAVYRQTKQLAGLNQALEDKTHEMEQFVYTVSHDLKSPLVSCKGLLGLLKEDLGEGAYADVIDSANRMEVATDQLSQIIDDVLALSRIGRKPLAKTDVNVREMVSDLKDELRPRLDDAHVELQIAPCLPNIRADESDLRRLFDNLLTNAIKYAADVDKPLIEVGGAESPAAVRYFVRDNGPGIEAEYQEKIFGLFQRLDNSKEGTGLGLASVRKIARMHGGLAWVESASGQGATFWIQLPKQTSSLDD